METKKLNVEDYVSAVTSEKKEKFEAFRAYLSEFNQKYNLTAITEEKDVLYKHFVDSLAGESLIKKGAFCAEIGSGAGFPSIPLKIYREDLSFTLFESIGKKCDFLRFVVDKLQLNGVNICNMRAEDAARIEKYREKFDCVVARAVAAMNTLCEYCMPFVKKGGIFAAYKSADVAELVSAEHAAILLGGKKIEKYPYALPEGYGERILAVVEKIKNTPEKYPRGNGKERKNPL